MMQTVLIFIAHKTEIINFVHYFRSNHDASKQHPIFILVIHRRHVIAVQTRDQLLKAINDCWEKNRGRLAFRKLQERKINLSAARTSSEREKKRFPQMR